MNLLKALLVGLWLINATAYAQTAPSASCLRIAGVVLDYASKQPLRKAQILVKLPSGQLKSNATTDSSGMFQASVPCSATAIIIEKTGYRPQTLSLRKLNISSASEVAVVIPMIAVDQLGSNKPYLQSEQTHFVQQTSAAEGDRSKAIQHGTFFITDAIRNEPLKATACLVFTESGAKECIETDTKGQFEFNFMQADIVAMEVSAPGYQTYAGNLIIEQLDGRSLRHEVRLQRELTLLTVQAEQATRCQVRADDLTVTLTNVPGRSNWYSTYDLVPRRYELIVEQPEQTTRRAITMSNGLNYQFIELKVSPKPTAALKPIQLRSEPAAIETKTVPIAGLVLPDTIPPIYFEQSSYKLRPDSEEVLRRVADYLKRHPDYRLHVVGHTDNVGDERLNQSLSEFRANVTVNYLHQQGIAVGRLTKAGQGSRTPISPNDTEDNKARNRRVSLQLTTTL